MTPVDADARHDIEHSLDETLFVEAGAGTGKTHELVLRVVNLIGGGVDPRRMAVITFTEAAAAELRERVRESLTREARDAADGIRRTHCESALRVLDDAAIGTLHSFAQRLLAEFPVEAGLPPGFEVLDEIEADIAFRARWDRWRDRVFEDVELAPAITTATLLGATTTQLERVARELNANWDLAREWTPRPAPVPAFDPGAVIAALDAAVALGEGCCAEDDALLDHLYGLEDLADDTRRAADPLEALELLADVKLTSTRGKKDNWPGGGKDAVLAALRIAEEAAAVAFALVRDPAMQTLLASLADFVRDSVEERRSEGSVEFHDLLVFAVELLRGRADVRAQVHDRYEHLLLDEFQDTDPLQIEMAVLIASPDTDAGDKPWWECSVGAGRLFVVGDPKQSIYRFRRADIELYRKVREVLGDGEGSWRALTTSFRGRPGIVEYVNEIFGALMADDDDPLQAPYEELGAHRDACAVTPDPVRTFGAAAPKGTELDQLRRLEASELAAIVRRVRDEGWQVGDADSPGGTRPARFSDIAILLPARTTLPYLEEALEDADVPVRIESQSLVFSTTEVHELLQVLQAIDDPIDDVAIVGALRSPGFACTDEQLVEFVAADGRWDYRVEQPPELSESHQVVAGMRELLALHERRWWDGVSELVERVIRERRLLELAVERRRPRDHWRRLRFVADAARAYADRGGSSLRGFVSWALQQTDEAARAVEVIVPEPDDDAVRVLTVHGAKGLEFPVVLLTGLGLREQPRTGCVLFGEDGPRVRIGRQDGFFVMDGFDELRTHEHEAWAAEQLRLLYVALTRAQDHLVLSLHHRENETDRCLASKLMRVASPRPELTGSAGRAPARETAVPDESVPVPDREAWIAARAARIERLRRAPAVAATGIAQSFSADDEDPALQKAEADATEAPPWRRGRAGTAVGRAVHAVLQTVDLATGAGLEATARAQALAEGIPAREDEITALARSVLDSDVVRRATSDRARFWREVPVAANVDGVLIEGFIDLLIETDEGFVVVDYKTDQVGLGAALDASVDRYTPQGAAYALALETTLDQPVASCVFVFARAGGAFERAVAELPQAAASVRLRAPELVAQPAL